MAKMAFTRWDEEDNFRKSQRGIQMLKFPEQAPKGSKVYEAKYVSEDDDSTSSFVISGTTDNEGEICLSIKKKKGNVETV